MAQRFRPVIEVEGLAPIKHCLRLSISQGIFDHHRFEIVVPHQALEGPAAEGFFQQAHHQLCGKRVTISLAPVAARGARPAFRFKGLITQLRLGSADDLAPVYVIEGYSPTYLLEGSAQRRTFVKQSLAQIGTAVLADYARNRLATQVTPSYRPLLPYTVQYDETDFAFLKRLAASRGEWLYYTGTDLVLGPPAPTPAVPFLVGGAQSFALTVSLRPTQFTAAEYDYRQHQTLRASSTAQPAPAHGTLASFAAQASEQLFAQPFRFAPGLRTHGPQQLDEAVRRLKSTLTGALVVFEGVGEQPDVAVGGLVAVEQPASGQRPAADLGRYRVLSVEHWLDDAGNYTNRFRAVPTGSAAPPVPVAAPVAGAMELAEVIDLNDPKRLGRVRVR
ncbi:MAG TPA: phage late control D family protein, partial [Hymenobacter sp.]